MLHTGLKVVIKALGRHSVDEVKLPLMFEGN